MIAKKMVKFVEGSSVTRAMFEEGKKMAVEFGAENVYDFSLGNPSVEPPKQVKEAIIETLNEDAPNFVHGYMNNSGYEEVRERIAQSLNRRFDTKFSQNNIIMTVGAAGGLNVALKTLLDPGDEVIAFAPYFGEYNNYVANFDGVMVVVPADVPSFQLDLETFAKKITAKTKAVIVNNPNNPTGMLISHRLLKKILEKCRKLDILLVVDECFLDFVKEPQEYSLKRSLSGFNNLFILKAFTKRYAMAGVRLGYGLCSNRKLLEKMELCVQPWNVSTMAQAAGIQALEETEYVEKGRQLVFQEAQWLKEEMTRIGYQVFPSEANYIFFKGPEELFDFCLRKRILIRDCSNYPGLKKGYYRVAVKRHEENIRLIEVLEGGILWQKQ